MEKTAQRHVKCVDWKRLIWQDDVAGRSNHTVCEPLEVLSGDSETHSEASGEQLSHVGSEESA
eukprot:597907-Amphidinium_carterae.1